jgi:hypothetical protein
LDRLRWRSDRSGRRARGLRVEQRKSCGNSDSKAERRAAIHAAILLSLQPSLSFSNVNALRLAGREGFRSSRLPLSASGFPLPACVVPVAAFGFTLPATP